MSGRILSIFSVTLIALKMRLDVDKFPSSFSRSYTVVPHFTIAPFNDETALRQTFCDHFCDHFMMFPMGEFRFVMIGSLLREPILRKTMIF